MNYYYLVAITGFLHKNFKQEYYGMMYRNYKCECICNDAILMYDMGSEL